MNINKTILIKDFNIFIHGVNAERRREKATPLSRAMVNLVACYFHILNFHMITLDKRNGICFRRDGEAHRVDGSLESTFLKMFIGSPTILCLARGNTLREEAVMNFYNLATFEFIKRERMNIRGDIIGFCAWDEEPNRFYMFTKGEMVNGTRAVVFTDYKRMGPFDVWTQTWVCNFSTEHWPFVYQLNYKRVLIIGYEVKGGKYNGMIYDLDTKRLRSGLFIKETGYFNCAVEIDNDLLLMAVVDQFNDTDLIIYDMKTNESETLDLTVGGSTIDLVKMPNGRVLVIANNIFGATNSRAYMFHVDTRELVKMEDMIHYPTQGAVLTYYQ